MTYDQLGPRKLMCNSQTIFLKYAWGAWTFFFKEKDGVNKRRLFCMA